MDYVSFWNLFKRASNEFQSLIKRYGLTIRAFEPRLVLNCRFVQVVFRTLVVFYSKFKEYENEARKKCVFFFKFYYGEYS